MFFIWFRRFLHELKFVIKASLRAVLFHMRFSEEIQMESLRNPSIWIVPAQVLLFYYVGATKSNHQRRKTLLAV